MALHFWDSFLDPSRGFDADSSLIAGVEPRQFVGAFEDYAKILDQCDFRTAVSSQDTLMDLLVRFEAANPHTSVRRNILFMNEQFFYYTESPYRCEDYFIPVLEAELELKGKEAPDKGDLSRYEFLLEGCKMNRIGSTAKDISLISPEGKRTRLSRINADYIVLIFENPGCQACKDLVDTFDNPDSTAAAWNCPQMADFIRRLPVLAEKKRVSFIAIYPDEDITDWKNHLDDYPSYWLPYRSSIPDRSAGYSLRAIPSIYLLDVNRTVLMKDQPVEKVLDYLFSYL